MNRYSLRRGIIRDTIQGPWAVRLRRILVLVARCVRRASRDTLCNCIQVVLASRISQLGQRVAHFAEPRGVTLRRCLLFRCSVRLRYREREHRVPQQRVAGLDRLQLRLAVRVVRVREGHFAVCQLSLRVVRDIQAAVSVVRYINRYGLRRGIIRDTIQSPRAFRLRRLAVYVARFVRRVSRDAVDVADARRDAVDHVAGFCAFGIAALLRPHVEAALDHDERLEIRRRRAFVDEPRPVEVEVREVRFVQHLRRGERRDARVGRVVHREERGLVGVVVGFRDVARIGVAGEGAQVAARRLGGARAPGGGDPAAGDVADETADIPRLVHGRDVGDGVAVHDVAVVVRTDEAARVGALVGSALAGERDRAVHGAGAEDDGRIADASGEAADDVLRPGDGAGERAAVHKRLLRESSDESADLLV